jgi:predicted transcriptional regulator
MKPLSQKSSRHSKIAGDFGEMLVLYYLSRYGFECARIDHTGIDLLARAKAEEKPWGISVKTASREEHRKKKARTLSGGDIEAAERACFAFNATPYLAIVHDEIDSVCVLLCSIEELKKERMDKKTFRFSFNEEHRKIYRSKKFSGKFIEMSVALGAWLKEPNQTPVPTTVS